METLLTGCGDNLAEYVSDSRFAFERTDVRRFIRVDVALDAVVHIATPATARVYLDLPIHSLKVGTLGTLNALGLGEGLGARRSCWRPRQRRRATMLNPAARVLRAQRQPRRLPRLLRRGQALRRGHDDCAPSRARGPGVDRAHFNTYGSIMCRDYGRAVPILVSQTLRSEPIAVQCAGSQTRSLSYVDDLVEGLGRLFVSDLIGPVNLGTLQEIVLELAERVRVAVGAVVPIEFTQRPEDDPQLRRPDISLARIELGWEPKVPLETGLEWKVAWASEAWTS
jgi:hypothetical protein